MLHFESYSEEARALLAKQFTFGSFQDGDEILGYSFEPMAGREERYLKGTIVDVVRHPQYGCALYQIEISENTENPDDDSKIGFIPVAVYGEENWEVARVQRFSF